MNSQSFCRVFRRSLQFLMDIRLNRSNRVIFMLYTSFRYLDSRACGFAKYFPFNCVIYFSLQSGFRSFENNI